MEQLQPHTSTSGCDLLLHLPPDILVQHVLVPYLSPRDKQALRQTSRLGRRLANAAVGYCVLDAYTDDAHAQTLLPSSFPNLRTLRIACTPPQAPTSSNASADTIHCLQQQLPAVLQQLPCLSHLAYVGPPDRRQQGLDMTPALQAAAAAAAATARRTALTPAPAAAAAAAAPAGDEATVPQPPPPLLLRVLELTCGSLPDALMEAVGALTGLQELRLNATAAIHMAPVAKLTGLSSITLTVTAPLPAAICPLSRLSRLASLELSALSPARGWGPVLARLGPACPLASLCLTFADICDEDIGALSAALTGLTHLDLNYSRHLTPACVQHLASLHSLWELNLQETGLTLGAGELLLLGGGCPRLHTLDAAFNLRDVPLPPWAAAQRPTAAAGAQPSRLFAASAAATQAQRLGGMSLSAPSVAAEWAALTAQHATTGTGSNSNSSSGSCGNGWPHLRQLILSGVSVSDHAKLISGFSSLTNLMFQNMGPNGTAMLLDLSQHAPPQLQNLTLSAAGAWSMAACTGLRSLPPLRSVVFSELSVNAEQSRALLQSLVLHAASLETLTLVKYTWLTDAALVDTVGRLTQLRQLSIMHCDDITASGLVSLAGRLPVLANLWVTGCRGVGPGAARQWERAAAAAAAALECGGPWAPKQAVVID